MQNLFLLPLLLLLLLSCNKAPEIKESVSPNKVKVIQIPEEINKHTADLENVISNIKIIPLETSKENLVARIDKLIFKNNKFYFYDWQYRKLMVADTEGNFLFNVNKQGRGPEEYTDLRDMHVDESGNIHCLSTKKIMIFDSVGNFKRNINLELPENYHINSTQFALAGSKGYYLWSGGIGLTRKKSGQYAVYKVDSKGKFTGDAYFPVEYELQLAIRFSPLGNNMYGMAPIDGCDTIYRFTSDKVYPMYYLDFGERKLPSGFRSEFDNSEKVQHAYKTTKYVVDVTFYFETSDLLFFVIRSNNRKTITVCRKSSGEVTQLLGPESFDYFPKIIGGVNSTLIGYFDAYKLIDMWESGMLKEKYGFLANYADIENQIKKMNGNDNPALVLITFKK